MTFSPLETLLIACILSLVSSIATKVWSNKAYMTRTECAALRSGCYLKEIKEDIEEIKQAYANQNKIHRILLTKLEVPIETQNELLGAL